MNGRTKTILKVAIVAMAMIVLLVAVSAEASRSQRLPNYRPMDLGSYMLDKGLEDITIHQPAFDLGQAAKSLSTNQPASLASCILATKYWFTYDDYNGYIFFDVYNLLAEGPNTQIWVQADTSWPADDPRDTPVVTCEQAAHVLAEFESNILPTEETFFGPAGFQDGSFSFAGLFGLPADYWSDSAGRQLVMVSNVRDDNYYDPEYPLYLAGFYWSVLDFYYDRNTMTIDAYDWENRTNTDGNGYPLYEAVFAHEYQHLLHSDYDSNEFTWINEGMSDWAEELTGYHVYGVLNGHINGVRDMPENSLVDWGDQGGLEILTDYGIAYLYMNFMAQHCTTDFNQRLFLDGDNQNISAVNAVLASLESDGIPCDYTSFADSYHDFAAALYTSGFDSEHLEGFQVDVGHPGKPNPEAFATEGAPPWGTDYHLLWGYERIGNMTFNGYEFNPMKWTVVSDTLYSGARNLTDSWLIFPAYVDGADPTLTFDTAYEIEEEWDFGFVQVSTDGGNTWTSLSNAYTSNVANPDAKADIVANLPGLSGSSGGWLSMSFDLSAYADSDVHIGFRYMTDWAALEEGWYVDNIDVSGTLISDGTSTDGFTDLNRLLGIPNEYTVTLIGERTRHGETEYEVLTVLTEGFAEDWIPIRDMFNNYNQLVMLVTYDAPEYETLYASYDVTIDHRGGANLK